MLRSGYEISDVVMTDGAIALLDVKRKQRG